MLFIALKRLSSRPILTLLTVTGIATVIALVVSIPIFSQAVSFVMFQEELAEQSVWTNRPPSSLRIYVSPASRYKVSLADSRALQEHIRETISSEMGLPVVRLDYFVETMGSVLRTRDQPSTYGAPYKFLSNIKVAVLPNVNSHMTILDGASIDAQEPQASGAVSDELEVWMHRSLATEMGTEVGERLEVHDPWRRATVPVRVAGIWEATDPQDPYWQLSPEDNFYEALLARPEDYQAIAEPLLRDQLGFAYWYLVIDDSGVVAERLESYAAGLHKALDVISEYLPGNELEGILVRALDTAVEREDRLTVLLFVFSVPVTGFLLYFLALIASISLRWQQRETAVMLSRGLKQEQLLGVSTVEGIVLVGLGLPLGALGGIQIARLMGYVKSFMIFTWRAPLPLSLTAYNLPMLIAAVSAAFLARLYPALRSTRTSVVAHERGRARAPDRPFWQRFYLDVLLLLPVGYAYRRLAIEGTLVPQVAANGGSTSQDPLLFLVPALFVLACSLLSVRIFPLLMRTADWLSAKGRHITPYLAWRQLARQSSQYTSALLLVISSLSLGAFLASMGASLDQWLEDQVYYEVGADTLIVQTVNPDPDLAGPITEGAWVLPADSYREIPGVLDATRVGRYPAKLLLAGNKTLRSRFLGVDRLDLPRVLFYRPDFSGLSLGELMNRLALREDAVLVSEAVLADNGLEIGDKVRLTVDVVDTPLTAEWTIAGAFKYFPSVYERGEGETAVIGNLDFLFQRIGATLMHDIWLSLDPQADKAEVQRAVRVMGVTIERWIDAHEEIAREQAMGERLGMFGTLTIGFLAAAVLSGVGLLVYNYASLQERLFRFTVLRAVGISLSQVIGQVSIEYLALMAYGVACGVSAGVWASYLFIPFFQSADQNVLRPPTMVPLIAWQRIGWIAVVFFVTLVFAQGIVLSAALRKGVFQALRMGDAE